MKKLKLLLFSLLIISLTHAQWTQIGSDIDGEDSLNLSGWSTSLSSTGNIVAIGAPQNSGYEYLAGHVRVFENSGENWIQIGSDINGENIRDFSGISVSLSDDGSIIAIGAAESDGNSGDINDNRGHVRVYEYNGGMWLQLGNDIDGEFDGDNSGRSVSLSADGSIVAVGAPMNDGNGNYSGQVRVYKYNGSDWIQQGNNINGESASDLSGFSVGLSSDGKILAIGAPYNYGSAIESGHARVYEFNDSLWLQKGNDIDGENANDWFGYSVSINSDGSIVAVGGPHNNGNGIYSGHARIYKYIDSLWIQMGSDIDGEKVGDLSGWSISISSDGSIVAIGAPDNDGNDLIETRRGHVRVFEYNGSTWIQNGNDIDGEGDDDNFGRSVSLNNDGSIVAIGAIWNGNDTIDRHRGHVRLYHFITGIEENTINTAVSIYPNPTTGLITIEAEGIESIDVFDLRGQSIIKHSREGGNLGVQSSTVSNLWMPVQAGHDINLASQPKGIYIIKVQTSRGVAVEKVIKN